MKTNICSTTLLSILLNSGAEASNATSSGFISNTAKYFKGRIQEYADNADQVSLVAVSITNYPSINIAPWLEPSSYTDEEREEIVYQVLEQASGAGSFNIVGHNITREVLDRIESSTSDFFSESVDYKKQFAAQSNANDVGVRVGKGPGYTQMHEEAFGKMYYKSTNPYENISDMREGYKFLYPSSEANVKAPDYFQESMDEFMEMVQPIQLALSMIITSALNLAKGQELPLRFFNQDEESDTTMGVLKTQRYSALPSEYDDATKLLPHIDSACISLLYSSEKGLEEIRDNRWVSVPIDKERGELHVNIGQILEIWSNGLFTGNIHRVSNNCQKNRISLAYFRADLDGKSVVPVCKEGEVARFAETSALQHFKQYTEA